jgi:putative ABC transport system permease protein
VAALIALPIATLSATAIAIRTVAPAAGQVVTETMGSTDIVLRQWPSGLRPGALRRELPAGARVVTARGVYTQNVIRGSTIYLPVRELSVPVDRPPVLGMFRLLQGRAPAAPDQAAVDPRTLAALGARVGDSVELEDVGLTLTVTGTLVDPEHVSDGIALVGPGTLDHTPGAGLLEVWIEAPKDGSAAEVAATLSKHPRLAGFLTRDDVARAHGGEELTANAGAFAAGALALFGTGLIVAAAFVVGARRQLRTLGLLGAQGGEPRHLRAAVLFGGVALGLAGSLLGVVLGVAGAFALHPYLTRISDRLVGPLRFPPLPLLGAVVLGTAAATLAALAPARAAGRLATLDALAGRTPPARSAGRVAAAGFVFVAAGAGLTAWGTVAHKAAVITAGLVMLVGGFLLGIPLLIAWLGRIAGRLPTLPRIAARDLARNGRRTGAALGAATIALALPVAVATSTLSNEASEQRIPYLAPDQLTVSVSPRGPGQPASLLRHRAHLVVGKLRAAFPRAVIVPLVPARAAGLRVKPSRANSAQAMVYASGGPRTAPGGVPYVPGGIVWIGGPGLLRAFHAEDGIGALEGGKVVSIGPGGTDGDVVHLNNDLGIGSKDLPAAEAGATTFGALTSSGEYNYVMAPDAAARAGLEPFRPRDSELQLILRAPRPLGEDDIERAKAIAAAQPGVSVLSLRDLGGHSTYLRTVLLLGASAVALAILAVVLALLGAESRKDRSILVAVGAGPGTRRRLAASGGFLVAAVAALLAVPTGFAPVAINLVSQRIGNIVVVPWTTIALVVVGVPVVAAVLAGAGSREPGATRLLNPIA